MDPVILYREVLPPRRALTETSCACPAADAYVERSIRRSLWVLMIFVTLTMLVAQLLETWS